MTQVLREFWAASIPISRSIILLEIHPTLTVWFNSERITDLWNSSWKARSP